MSNPIPGGRSGGRSSPIQMNGPPQMPNPMGRSGGIKSPQTGENNPNPTPLGRSGGIKLPPIEKNTMGGRGIKLPPIDNNNNQNPPPMGRSGGRSNPIDNNNNQNPTPMGRSGGRSNIIQQNNTIGQNPPIKMMNIPPPIKNDNVQQNNPPNNPPPRNIPPPIRNDNVQQNNPPNNPPPRNIPPPIRNDNVQQNNPPNNPPPRNIPPPIRNDNVQQNNPPNNPPPRNIPPPIRNDNVPQNIPPPIRNDNVPQNIPPPIRNVPSPSTNTVPQNIPPPIRQEQPTLTPTKQPTKVVMPQINMPVKETVRETPKSLSSLVNPTFLVVSSNVISGKFLPPINSDGLVDVTTKKVKASKEGPRPPIISAPLYRSAKPWEMPFKVPEIEANVEYIQPTAPLEQLPKVHREPSRKIKGDAWTKVKGPLMLYSKIKKGLTIETCNRKEKRYMGIYFNWIIFWGSTGNKPEESDDMPVTYFDLDNVLDSTEIKINEKKLELTLPLLPNMGAKNVKFGFDVVEDLRNWWKETKKIVAVLEKTERNDMINEDMIKLKLAEINLIFPEKNFIPMGVKEVIDWKRAGEWFAEMKNLYTQQRLISRYLRRVKLFQQYAIGAIGSYINWFFGSEGPHITLGKVEEVVFENWTNIINDNEKLIKELLSEQFVDGDHLPFHMEDCQVSVHIVDLMNWYPTYVHNVKRDPQMMDRVQLFKQYFAKLSVKPVSQ
eukprot:TRINITY_DN133_c0_g1_i4.p1 TRINITY_DN133_c0_g1~~TRINITY_DN133_c0_g1_i4.p1  ORF type:complete len:715 (-),score=284.24 TRINITY_DN133_c0_g1_i4:90-2234(-)